MSAKPRILIVEDEPNLLEGLCVHLGLQGFTTIAARHGKEALEKAAEQKLDAVVLDLMLPEIDGFEVCRRLKLERPQLPVLMLTARNAPADRVKGLRTGADDYLTKPFDAEELVLRLQNLLRRSGKETHPLEEYILGPYRILFREYRIVGPAGKQQSLSQKEALLLRLFIEKEGQVMAREEILSRVWGYEVYPSTRTVDNFVSNLRRYFGDDPRNPGFFHSVRGVGYKFTAPDRT